MSKSTYFAEVGEYDIALELINQSMPNYDLSPLYNIRSYVYNKKGDFDKALSDANKSIALDSSKPNAYKNKGIAYAGLNDKQSAVKEFDKALKINPEYAEAYYERAKAHFITDKAKYISDIKSACKFGNNNACDTLIAEKLN